MGESKYKFSVVVCVKNEAMRLEECLKHIVANDPDEIIVVDGSSTDNTVDIARRYTNQVIVSTAGGLTADRQIGIDAARNELVAMIDADHRLRPNDISSLIDDLFYFDFDLVQSQLISYENHSYWNAAEEATWEITINRPGPKAMVGTAPAIYRKRIFDKVRFDSYITEKMDDTDFVYRLSKHKEFKYGMGRTRIRQLHFDNFRSYFKKFLWYGRGDGEFCRKHPRRAYTMFFHLLVRYPYIFSLQAIRRRKPYAIPFLFMQGNVRALGMFKYLFGALQGR